MGCKVPLTGVPQSRLIIDFDKEGSPISSTETRCDFLVVVERQSQSKPNLVLPLELKKGKLQPNKIREQLSAGARTAEKLVPKHIDVRFIPIAAIGRTLRYHREVLKRKNFRIRFRDEAKPIELISCGSSLATVDGF